MENQDHILNARDAKLLIRKAPVGSHFNHGARIELPIPEQEGKCYPGYAIISLSRKQALKLIGDVLCETFEGKGARIKISIHTNKYYYIG